MVKKLMLAMAILSLICACAVPRAKLDSNPAYSSHHFSNHELDISWKAENTDKGMRIDGTLKNVRPDLPYTSLQLTAKLLDDSGKELGKGTKNFEGRFTGSEAFTMDIPLPRPESVKRVNFSYSYGTTEDFHRDDFNSVP
ncbi:hypothetical protein KOM00_01010 [Geomonas sp. Red69]|uniref:Lipoprotein n=1 Tax=Geomonas diazotrophica TaxID=2843197 RepID=A0ABX8JLW3_9BACT|nr:MULTISPECIES: hypothetical protein [Geomonas]MBU5635308.1 hypothetical protein [Geomonas diazotrophica]QWV97632.1 hypothetical protein KP005_20245 [Geomonas nitrogeniifigens]QXE86775.1 hypothetical protein KP003_20910 [Geomonas nitrogeniifigens]